MLCLVLITASFFVQQMRAETSPSWQGVWLEITTGSEPSIRAAHSVIWDSYNNRMIVFGGTSYDSQEIGLSDVWMYDPALNTWLQGSDAPMTRAAHVAVWDTQNNQMILYGGESYYGSYYYYQDTWTYNPTTDTWTQRADGPTKRAWATGVWDSVHNQMIMFGGYDHSTDSALGDTWAYVPSTDTWVRKADGPGARHAHMAVWNSRDNTMIVFGGRSLTYGEYGWWTDTWIYDPGKDQWYQKADIPSPLAQASAVWDPLHNVVIVFGGETAQDSSNVPAGETWIYDPALDKWIVLDTETQPPARNWLQAVHVWDSLNNQMILFGGNAATGYLNDLWTLRISLSAIVDIDPDTLNLKSNGEWITAYIELPEGYSVGAIEVSTILLNGSISVDPEAPTEVGDYDEDGIPDLMVKFDRAAVIEWLGTEDYNEDTGKSDKVTLVITGEVAGIPFEGSDTINVLKK